MPDIQSQNDFVPFDNIALTFSGGGFRAAAFALGTLSYLNKIQLDKKPLLEKVKSISTVSGGTITGVAYALSLTQCDSFNAFYSKLFKLLKEGRLLPTALAFLESKNSPSNNHKRRSLINSFAAAYEKLITSSKTFDEFLKGPIGHLDEVIFNATDFNFALPFRFQNKGYFGNGNLGKGSAFLQNTRSLIKLSDIIAASSCFPVGFEPMIFPDDFIPSHLKEYTDLKNLEHFKKGVGLMDGGIVDNQGVNSILLSQQRRKTDPFNLILITDVASPYLTPWEPSDESFGSWRASSYSTYNWNIVDFLDKKISFLVYVCLVVSLSILVAGLFVNDTGLIKLLVSLGTLGTTLTGIYICSKLFLKDFVVKEIKQSISNVVEKIPPFYRPLLIHFEKIRFGLMERMLRERGSSTVSILNDIFLKQVRRLTYYQVYQNKEWRFKRISNLVYELTEYDFKAKQKKLEKESKNESETINSSSSTPSIINEENIKLKGAEEENEKGFMKNVDPSLQDPGENIFKSAIVAAKMDTTLWFEESHIKERALEHLVACGQYTTCYNLLIYLSELEEDPKSPFYKKIINGNFGNLYQTLLKDWDSFKKNPFQLLLDENGTTIPLK